MFAHIYMHRIYVISTHVFATGTCHRAPDVYTCVYMCILVHVFLTKEGENKPGKKNEREKNAFMEGICRQG